MTKKYKINIDPRILELLGPNLYTNIYYILAELIANAYDAAAKNVYIIINENEYIVEDDGVGMSYEDGDVDKYLNVAAETRKGPDDDYVKGTERRKMGRKGVGKLAALSVSSRVEVLTRRDEERSGFVLSRHVSEDKTLESIPDEDIVFRKIEGNGTSIIMRDPQYDFHKTLPAIRSNILKLFPHINSDFKIHLVKGDRELTLDSYDEEIVHGLSALICLGEEYHYLGGRFDSGLGRKYNAELCSLRDKFKKVLSLRKKDGEVSDFNLEIKGWIGTYKSTRNRKKDHQDFPDNFISLFANNKVGEYNILPSVGKNRLSESYVVGQLHVDLFEETSLPDMALSNRQGYKGDDTRYSEVIGYVREKLLPEIIALRTKYANVKSEALKAEKNEKKRKNEERLKVQYNEYKEKTSRDILKRVEDLGVGSEENQRDLQKFVELAINKYLPTAGFKSSIDESKKKVLISHSGRDSDLAEVVYQLLEFNGIGRDEIIYTSSEHEESRVPNTTAIFDYLRDFFVDSVSTEKIYVIYVTSEKMAESWAAVCEVGAGWVTKSKHDIFNIKGYLPSEPLNVRAEWHESERKNGGICVSVRGADLMAAKIRDIGNFVKGSTKSKQEIYDEVSRLVNIE